LKGSGKEFLKRLREGVGARVQESSEVSIAKSVDRKLATMDGGQQGMVVCLKGT
jgi:hypothetical protein